MAAHAGGSAAVVVRSVPIKGREPMQNRDVLSLAIFVVLLVGIGLLALATHRIGIAVGALGAAAGYFAWRWWRERPRGG